MDRPVKFRRQINTRWGEGSRAAIAVTEFRVRCMSEKLLDTTGKGIRHRQLTMHEAIREASYRT
jgi:hypothetical protein